MKAAVIVTDADILYCAEEWWEGDQKIAATVEHTVDGLSEQLLADLRTLTAYAGGEPRPAAVLAAATARVRALLPEEDK